MDQYHHLYDIFLLYRKGTHLLSLIAQSSCSVISGIFCSSNSLLLDFVDVWEFFSFEPRLLLLLFILSRASSFRCVLRRFCSRNSSLSDVVCSVGEKVSEEVNAVREDGTKLGGSKKSAEEGMKRVFRFFDLLRGRKRDVGSF